MSCAPLPFGCQFPGTACIPEDSAVLDRSDSDVQFLLSVGERCQVTSEVLLLVCNSCQQFLNRGKQRAEFFAIEIGIRGLQLGLEMLHLPRDCGEAGVLRPVLSGAHVAGHLLLRPFRVLRKAQTLPSHHDTTESIARNRIFRSGLEPAVCSHVG